MAFNKISLLSVEDINVSQVNIQHVQDLATSISVHSQDIFYHFGTDLGQNVSWTNPVGGVYLTITSNKSGNLSLLTDRNDTTNFDTTSEVGAPITITFQFLTGFEIDLQAFRYKFATSSSYAWRTFTWEGSNDGVSWDVIYSARELQELNAVANSWYYEPVLDNRPGFYSYLRLNFTDPSVTDSLRVAGLEIFGKVRNLTTGVAGFKTPGDRFDNLLNVDAYNPRNNREIIYDASSNVWESRINQPWTVVNEVMTGDITLTRADLRNPRFYILTPNGATRNITLPTPEVNDAIKFRNLDGSFDINIFEQGDPTPVVLSNSGKLQYEYVYDGTEFHVIG